MATYKRKWWRNIYLEFYLNIPLLRIETRLFKEAFERYAYDICRVHIQLWKWSWDFKLYKRPDEYATGEVSTRCSRAKAWLKRKLVRGEVEGQDNG